MHIVEGTPLLNAVTVTGAGTAQRCRGNGGTAQANVAGTGTVTATVNIEVGNIPGVWEILATITLSGTASDHDGMSWVVPWTFVRANCTGITGTGAKLTVVAGGAG